MEKFQNHIQNSKNIWNEIEGDYLPEHSKSTKEVNCLLKKLYQTNLKNSFDKLEEIVNENNQYNQKNPKSNQKTNSKLLITINNTLNHTQTTLEQLEQKEYYGNCVEIKSKQYKLLENQFEKFLEEIIQNSYCNLKDLNKKIKQNKENPEILKELREKADSIDNYFFDNGSSKVIQILHQRDLLNEETDYFYNYNNKKLQRQELEKEIDFLEKTYIQLEHCITPKKEIKRLLKLTKTGFFKSEISKRCKQNNYYQGINKLKEIHTKLKKQEFETIKIQENYFSLSAYISSIGMPENFTYFPIVNLLNKGKFKELRAYLPSLTVNSKKDRDYIGKIKYGLKKALELPEPNLNLAQIEQSYTLINQIKGG